MTRIQQPEITEIKHCVMMWCPICNISKIIKKEDVQFAYLEINKFRKEHEHVMGQEK